MKRGAQFFRLRAGENPEYTYSPGIGVLPPLPLGPYLSSRQRLIQERQPPPEKGREGLALDFHNGVEFPDVLKCYSGPPGLLIAGELVESLESIGIGFETVLKLPLFSHNPKHSSQLVRAPSYFCAVAKIGIDIHPLSRTKTNRLGKEIQMMDDIVLDRATWTGMHIFAVPTPEYRFELFCSPFVVELARKQEWKNVFLEEFPSA